MKLKFTLIDYIIIILVICAVIFAFIHITSDDTSTIQKTAFDSSTANKIIDTYSNYYKDGYIVKATLNGFNSTNGEEVTINGTVKWVDDGNIAKILVQSENETYLTGLYKNVKNADVYMDKISLESDGSKYQNLKEFTIKPQQITSLNDLVKDLNGSDYEISTTISLDSVDSTKIQEIENKIESHNKRLSIKSNDNNNQLILTQSDKQNIEDGNSVLGSFNGITDEITIRIYNCSDDQLNAVKENYDVVNIRNF